MNSQSLGALHLRATEVGRGSWCMKKLSKKGSFQQAYHFVCEPDDAQEGQPILFFAIEEMGCKGGKLAKLPDLEKVSVRQSPSRPPPTSRPAVSPPTPRAPPPPSVSAAGPAEPLPDTRRALDADRHLEWGQPERAAFGAR